MSCSAAILRCSGVLLKEAVDLAWVHRKSKTATIGLDVLIYTSIEDFLSASVVDGSLYHQLSHLSLSEDSRINISGNRFIINLFVLPSYLYLGPCLPTKFA